MKTISSPISGSDEASVALPPPAVIPAEIPQSAVVPAAVQAVAPAVPTTSDMAAGQTFVTVALSINISANGLYASSRCTSPSRAGGAAIPAIDSGTHCGVAGASVPLKLCLGDPGSRSGFSSLPSSHPQTPQAGTAVDTSLMDLHHKLTSLSMTNNIQPQQHPAEVAPQQLPSPTSSAKEGIVQAVIDPSPPSAAAQVVPVPTAGDQVDQSNGDGSKQPRKVLPSTIDIHDLEAELSKLHSRYKEVPTSAEAGAVSAQPSTSTASPPEPIEEEQHHPAPIDPKEVVPVAKEQKAIQTEPVPEVEKPTELIPPNAAPPGRRVSRFSVSLVDEKSRPSPVPEPQPVQDLEDPELRELLTRHEMERKELAKKQDEELSSFHARRKQQLQQQLQQQQQMRNQVASRTPSPGAVVQPVKVEQPTVNGSVPGTPTRTANRTFTEDLLRLVQDLGSKTGAGEKAEGGEKAKAPTLNQLRATTNGCSSNSTGGSSSGGSSNSSSNNSHSLTQTAGIFPPSCLDESFFVE